MASQSEFMEKFIAYRKMGQLDDFSVDQLADVGALSLGSLGALLHVIFQSRCTRIPVLWVLEL